MGSLDSQNQFHNHKDHQSRREQAGQQGSQKLRYGGWGKILFVRAHDDAPWVVDNPFIILINGRGTRTGRCGFVILRATLP